MWIYLLVLLTHPPCEMNSWLRRYLLGCGKSVARLKERKGCRVPNSSTVVTIASFVISVGLGPKHTDVHGSERSEFEFHTDTGTTLWRSAQSGKHGVTLLTGLCLAASFTSHRYQEETSVTWSESSWRGSDAAASSWTGFSTPYRRSEGKKTSYNRNHEHISITVQCLNKSV